MIYTSQGSGPYWCLPSDSWCTEMLVRAMTLLRQALSKFLSTAAPLLVLRGPDLTLLTSKRTGRSPKRVSTCITAAWRSKGDREVNLAPSTHTRISEHRQP